MENTVESLKMAIDSVGRLRVAQKLDMQYSTLSAKMNGFVSWQAGEVDKVLMAAEELRMETPNAKI